MQSEFPRLQIPPYPLSVRVSGLITQLQHGCKCKDLYGIPGNRFKKKQGTDGNQRNRLNRDKSAK